MLWLVNLTVDSIYIANNIMLFFAVDELELLLELEYKYGTPTKFKPAIQDVLSYYENVTIKI